MMDRYEDYLPIDQGEDLWWVFYLEPGKPSPIYREVVGAFASLGCEIAETDVAEPAEAGDGDPFCVVMFDPAHGHILELMIAGGSQLFLGMHAQPFLDGTGPAARARADVLLEYAKECIRLVRPRYGYAESMDFFPDVDDVMAGRIAHMFWAQYFGPAASEAIGRGLLAGAPAWRNENVWGGILYVLAASPFLRGEPREYWYAARSYFERHYAHEVDWRG